MSQSPVGRANKPNAPSAPPPDPGTERGPARTGGREVRMTVQPSVGRGVLPSAAPQLQAMEDMSEAMTAAARTLHATAQGLNDRRGIPNGARLSVQPDSEWPTCREIMAHRDTASITLIVAGTGLASGGIALLGTNLPAGITMTTAGALACCIGLVRCYIDYRDC